MPAKGGRVFPSRMQRRLVYLSTNWERAANSMREPALDSRALDVLLKRLRDAVHFLLKADGVVLASLVTLASAFRVAPREALGFAADFREVLVSLGFFMSFLLFFELLTTSIPRYDDSRINRRLSWWFRWSYGMLALGHIFLLVYVLGFVHGYLRRYWALPT